MINKALLKLDEDERIILTLFYFEELSLKEIVEIVSMTEGNVKVKLFRIRKKLLNEIIQEVKKVNGLFIPVFHNYTFSEMERWYGFKDLFNLIIESSNEA